MDDNSDKLLNLLIKHKIEILNGEIDEIFSPISMNIDLGNLDLNRNFEDYKFADKILKKTNKVVFLTTTISDQDKNTSTITSIWSIIKAS
ncbi:MAG: hypothetical protein VYB67_02845 [Pseudomonadota bacterium]|nr:hypothetical protein [Pseudomonadota bacterium]